MSTPKKKKVPAKRKAKKRRPKKLTRTVKYKQYIKSEKWHEKRMKVLKRASFRCQICFSDQELQVHHRTYKDLGHERLCDLTVMCKTCHQLFHDNLRLAPLPKKNK